MELIDKKKYIISCGQWNRLFRERYPEDWKQSVELIELQCAAIKNKKELLRTASKLWRDIWKSYGYYRPSKGREKFGWTDIIIEPYGYMSSPHLRSLARQKLDPEKRRAIAMLGVAARLAKQTQQETPARQQAARER